ncbi:phospholipase A1-Ibeta2, chloroplastic-like [Phragmites australis]|uniref:phospholipase A1-Ibeta2, chloroplastic-like n=1 Tax=Phragmites australis TaxID=29695 RepID=UPI002D7A0BEF|nr:phospholipase A1-Ibeta2, chloroplastic-like [Phragmites australis]
MSTAAAPPPQTLHRPAVTTRVAAAPSNSVHLANLESLFRNRGADEGGTDKTAAALQPVEGRRRQQPLLRLPSFLARIRGEAVREETAPALSPRRLERLLQPVAPDGPSPRGNIAAAWRRLHGEDGWRGLLDPLHPDLRREIVRYGEFVDASYGSFLARPDAAPGDLARVPLQDAAYRVTTPLFATSSVGLPPWLSAAVPCAGKRTSIVGYVAVCDNPAEVRRMGRRDIVIALRGTCTVLEWAENVRAGLVQATDNAIASPDSSNAKVECGFWNLYKTAGDRSPSLSEMVVSEVRRLLNKYKGEEVSVTVTGHSLGAALAVLIADELAGGVAGRAQAPVAVFSFGGPRVGNRAFAERVEARGARVLRLVNAHDVVPRFPPGLPLPGYADVGRELRLDSRASPYLRPDADAACCHDLEAYIHLVDGFLGSHCPFRANAKRSILRLVKNQGGNVKQLYISKARDMHIQLEGGTDMPGSLLSSVDMPGTASTVVECVH